MSTGFTESDAEEAALGWLESLGYTIRRGAEIAYNVDGDEPGDKRVGVVWRTKRIRGNMATPDKQESAAQTVLEQAALSSEAWTAAA